MIVISRCIAYYLEIQQYDDKSKESTKHDENPAMFTSPTIPDDMSQELVLDTCFRKQLDRLDSFLYHIEASRHHLDPPPWKYHVPDGKSGLDVLLDEMEDVMEDEMDDQNDKILVHDSDDDVKNSLEAQDMDTSIDGREDAGALLSTQNEECEEEPDEEMLSDNDKEEHTLNVFGQESFRTMIFNLRNQLLKFPKNATASEVQAVCLSIPH